MNIFLSYSWSCTNLANELQISFGKKHIKLKRDIHDLEKMDNVKEFMISIRDTEYSLLLINDDYLKSSNCMFEMFQLFQEKDYAAKIIPVIYPDTAIFKPEGKIKYIEFWANKKKDLEDKASIINQLSRIEIDKEIKWTEFIARNVGDVLTRISDFNTITYDNDPNKCFTEILELVYKKVLSKEIRYGKVKRNPIIALPEKVILSIDFGTSYSLASIQNTNAETVLIPDITGKLIIPSKVAILPDGKYEVGNCISQFGIDVHTHILGNIKRQIGNKKTYPYGKNEISIELLIGILVKSLTRNAEEYLGISIKNIMLSVPTAFGLSEMKILAEGASIAGLQVIRMVQEASVVSLLSESKQRELILNLDLGGGTFDMSLADKDEELSEIIYTLGDKQLGGIDYDYLICEYIFNELHKKYNIPPIIKDDSALYTQILFEAEKAKIKLNTSNSVNMNFEASNDTGNIIYYEVTISRDRFRKISKDLNKRITDLLLQIKKYIKMEGKLDYIFLTGQGTKLFLIREIINEMFPGIEIIDKYQENAVALGLSVQAGILSGTTKKKLLLECNHIQLEVLCFKCPDPHSIHFSKNNDITYHKLFGNDYSYCNNIPTCKMFEIKFEDSFDEEYEIKFYESGQNDRVHIHSIFMIPQKDIEFSMELSIDVNQQVEITISDHHGNHIVQASLMQLSGGNGFN